MSMLNLATAATLTDDESLYEVVNHQRKELARMGAFENLLASILSQYMGIVALKDRCGVVVTETLFLLDSVADLQRRPDVAFVSYAGWPERTVPRVNAWNVVPDLAVEVVSQTNTAEEIDGKITDYFAAGVHLVWVLYPDSGRVYVYESPTRVHGLEKTDELDGGSVLPNFRLPIQTLFAAVEKPE